MCEMEMEASTSSLTHPTYSVAIVPIPELLVRTIHQAVLFHRTIPNLDSGKYDVTFSAPSSFLL